MKNLELNDLVLVSKNGQNFVSSVKTLKDTVAPVAVQRKGNNDGTIGALKPGHSVNYDPLTGEFNMIVESGLNYVDVIGNDPGELQSPHADAKAGDFYIIAEDTWLFDATWGNLEGQTATRDDIVILGEDLEYDVIERTTAAGVAKIISGTEALVVDNGTPAEPVLTINEVTDSLPGLMAPRHLTELEDLDDKLDEKVNKSGDTVTGRITFEGNKADHEIVRCLNNIDNQYSVIKVDRPGPLDSSNNKAGTGGLKINLNGASESSKLMIMGGQNAGSKVMEFTAVNSKPKAIKAWKPIGLWSNDRDGRTIMHQMMVTPFVFSIGGIADSNEKIAIDKDHVIVKSGTLQAQKLFVYDGADIGGSNKRMDISCTNGFRSLQEGGFQVKKLGETLGGSVAWRVYNDVMTSFVPALFENKSLLVVEVNNFNQSLQKQGTLEVSVTVVAPRQTKDLAGEQIKSSSRIVFSIYRIIKYKMLRNQLKIVTQPPRNMLMKQLHHHQQILLDSKYW